MLLALYLLVTLALRQFLPLMIIIARCLPFITWAGRRKRYLTHSKQMEYTEIPRFVVQNKRNQIYFFSHIHHRITVGVIYTYEVSGLRGAFQMDE